MPRETHYLHVTGDLTAADVPACYLSMWSRGRMIPGGECRPQRDELAGLVGPGPLADLLRSGRPIAVRGVRDGYRIEADAE